MHPDQNHINCQFLIHTWINQRNLISKLVGDYLARLLTVSWRRAIDWIVKQKYRTFGVGGLLDCCRQPAIVHGVDKRSLWVALPPISPPQIRLPTAAPPSKHPLSHLSQRRWLPLGLRRRRFSGVCVCVLAHTCSLFVWLVGDGWCWFVLRKKVLLAGLFWEKSTAGW
jgi:hypothetical protein